MTTLFELEIAEEKRIAEYFAATPEERKEMREAYAAQIVGELAMAKLAFESEE